MIAVIPVRSGRLPAGGAEAIAEAGGRALLVGGGTAQAALELRLGELDLSCFEADGFAPRAWADALVSRPNALAPDSRNGREKVIVLPASPDGRDLGPHLAHRLGRAFYAGAIAVSEDMLTLSRADGRIGVEHRIDRPSVATLQPGVRGVEARDATRVPSAERLDTSPSSVELVAILEPDPETIRLSEADRIIAGGQGLGSAASFVQLASAGRRLRAAVGGTRVAVDRGWLSPDRQIGVSGASVAPELYLAFGISGAVQHIVGLAHPAHTIAVNIDSSCPMMAMADLAIVADAPATLEHLLTRLAESPHG